MTLLRFAAVSKSYSNGAETVHALNDVSLSVDVGEFVAIMGPSGSGKSTLLGLAGGLDSPTSGEIWIEGRPLVGLSPGETAALRREAIGYVFQDFNLIGTLTAEENVALPLELSGMGKRKAVREANSRLAEVTVADLAGRFPSQMSGGQQQRVAIARALVGRRRLLLADEPTGSLDSTTGREVIAVIRARVGQGAACVMVTHDQDLGRKADRIIHLRDGRVSDEGELGPSRTQEGPSRC